MHKEFIYGRNKMKKISLTLLSFLMIFLFSELLIGKVNRFSANTIEEYNFISKEEYQKI